jgi:TM2 domain-containing membrane protein YozV
MALIKCSECGAEISDKADQCIKCGCPISKTDTLSHEESIYCTHCGKENYKNIIKCKFCSKEIAVGQTIFCKYCGTKASNDILKSRCSNCHKLLKPKKRSLIISENGGCLAMFLSLLIPGLGQFLMGQVIAGIVFFIVAVVIALPTLGIGYLAMSIISMIAVGTSTISKCHHCKSIVDSMATICKHCQSDLIEIVEE